MGKLKASLKQMAGDIISGHKAKETGNINKWALPSVLLLGVALRLWGIGYGLPASFIPDESVIVNKAAAMGGGDLNPHFFGYPTFFIYITAFFYGLLFILGRLTGLIASVQDFQAVFFTDPTAFFLTVRGISVLFGAASIWLVWKLAKHLYSELAGILAALLLCVCFAHVQDSRFAFINIPLSFWTTLTLFFMCRITYASRKLWKYYAWAGVFFGLAFSTKYTAVYLVIPFAAAHFIRLGPSALNKAALPGHLKLAFSLSLAGLALFATSPFVFLDYGTFMNYFNMLAPRVSAASFDFSVYIRSCLKDISVINDTVGLPVLLLAAAGFVLSLIRKKIEELPLHVFTLSYIFIFLARLNLPHIPPRYIDPLIPVLCVFAANALCSCLCPFLRARSVIRSGAAAAVIFLLLYSPLRSNFICASLLCRKDTRTMAREWIERNIPGRAVAIYGPSYHFPPVYESRKLMQDKYDFIMNLGRIRGGDYSDIFSGPRSYAVKLSLPQYPPVPNYYVYELVDGLRKIEIPKTWELPADTGLKSLKAKGIKHVILAGHEVFPFSEAGQSLERRLSGGAELVFDADPLKKDGQGVKEALTYDTTGDTMPLSGWSLLESLGPRIRIYRI